MKNSKFIKITVLFLLCVCLFCSCSKNIDKINGVTYFVTDVTSIANNDVTVYLRKYYTIMRGKAISFSLQTNQSVLTDNMKTEDIPYDYTYCYATDEQCPKAVHCLCSHAAMLNEEQAISLNSRFTGDQKRHPRLN